MNLRLTSTERSSSVMASRTLLQKGHASNSKSCKLIGGSEAIFSLEALSITDFLPHANLDVLAKEDVASSKAKLRCPEGSPPYH